MDKIKAEADVRRTLGTLRYLNQLQASERRKSGAGPSEAPAGAVTGVKLSPTPTASRNWTFVISSHSHGACGIWHMCD
jgi:hypothetical protein